MLRLFDVINWLFKLFHTWTYLFIKKESLVFFVGVTFWSLRRITSQIRLFSLLHFLVSNILRVMWPVSRFMTRLYYLWWLFSFFWITLFPEAAIDMLYVDYCCMLLTVVCWLLLYVTVPDKSACNMRSLPNDKTISTNI